MKKIHLTLFLVTFTLISSAQTQVITDIKNSIIYIGFVKKKQKGTYKEPGDSLTFITLGTGFVIGHKSRMHAVTAKHVITKKDRFGATTNELIDEDIVIAYQGYKNNLVFSSSKEQHLVGDFGWKFLKNDNMDIAVSPIFIPRGGGKHIINQKKFASIEELEEMKEVCFLAYHPHISFHSNISPIIRMGTISKIDNDSTMLIDATSFPGNSGAPVFMLTKKNDTIIDNKIVKGIYDDYKVIGIIGGFINYTDIAYSRQTNKARATFEDNTGLTKIWAIDKLKELLESNEVNEQIERMRKAKKKPSYIQELNRTIK